MMLGCWMFVLVVLDCCDLCMAPSSRLRYMCSESSSAESKSESDFGSCPCVFLVLVIDAVTLCVSEWLWFEVVLLEGVA